MILKFSKEYDWLSNFHKLEKPMEHLGLSFETIENYYVGMKTLDIEERRFISILAPGKAKRYGRKLQLREDWENVKLSVMRFGTRYKFSINNPILRQKLIDTGDVFIREGNNWGDTYWGVDTFTGEGENHLGKIIMKVREDILEGKV